MPWDWNSWGGWWVVIMSIMMVIFWGGIIALIVWAIRRFTNREHAGANSGKHNDPLDIAKERYARGEITKEQYDQIKKDL